MAVKRRKFWKKESGSLMQNSSDNLANNDGKRQRELTLLSNEHVARYANSTLICKINGESLTVEKLRQLCLRIGIRNGDVIFLHSSLVSLGNLEIEDSQRTLSLLVRSFQEVVGREGTVIMPTFTYSFLDETWSGPKEPYDVENSRSKTGVLTEYFRQLPDVIRSSPPTHSVAIWGNKKEYFADIDDSTIGTASIFGKIHSTNAKIVGLGSEIPSTFIHYIERQANVPYREGVISRGYVLDLGKPRVAQVRFFQRVDNYSTVGYRFQSYLYSKNLIHSIPLNDGKISCIDANTLYESGMMLLSKDPYFFAYKPTSMDELNRRLRAVVKRWSGFFGQSESKIRWNHAIL